MKSMLCLRERMGLLTGEGPFAYEFLAEKNEESGHVKKFRNFRSNRISVVTLKTVTRSQL